MKKILSLVLAMLMIFSMVPAVFAAETSESDYQAAIEYLKALELYKGTTDGDAADELVERYQMALFTARMVTGRVDKAYWETDANDSGFTDIDELNAEALGGVCYAAQQGIVNGIGGSEFAPFDNVTYRDAIVMIVRALGFNYPASGYPWSYINKARELGVLDGITGVSYTAEVKREVIAQLLYNAINAEIKGESIAANVFGVEETIVMVTATYDLVYGAGASTSLKDNMVKVSAIDAEGEPIGAEYYVPYSVLGAKSLAQANALVGTNFKLTHKGNFSQFLAVESLTKVFESTPAKHDVTYHVNSGVLTLGGDKYQVIVGTGNLPYTTTLNNNQDVLGGTKEIKVFKAFGATGPVSTGTADYILAADGNIYAKNNPFTPYAIYSDLVDAWFKVLTAVVTEEIPGVDDDPATTDKDETENRYFVTTEIVGYERLNDEEVEDLLKKSAAKVMGFERMGTSDGYYQLWAPRIANSYGVDYDYYKAIASDIDGDGDYDRVTVRPYELFRITKQDITRKVDNSDTTVTVFKATTFKNPVNNGLGGETESSAWLSTTKFDAISYTDTTDVENGLGNVYLCRSTGTALNKVPNGAFVVAYLSDDGVGKEREIEIVEVIGGEQKNADDNAYVFQTYIRGYDSVTNKVIYGANYDTMYFGTYAVKNSSAFDAPHAKSDERGLYTAATAKYVQQFWNKYVNVYVLNGAVIYIEAVGNSNDFVILESFTDFTEDGLKAMAYSTKDGGYAEVTIGELNGWSLGGYDYELFMLLKQMTDLGLTVKDYPLPIALNKIYAVRSVDENGAYNLVEPVALNEGRPASIYVNNFGYILGVKSNGTLDASSRVATSDKDLWIIQTQKCVAYDVVNGEKVYHDNKVCKGETSDCEVVNSNVVMFKGKLSAIELVGFKWYKVADNQYVAVAPVGYELGPILGNTSEGLDYWMYNQYINNYKNETLFNGFYYGHYMTNVRTGAVEFVTYDSKLASDLFANNPTLNNNYIVLTEGAIYPAINKVLKTTTQATMADVAALQYASAKYHAFNKAAVGAVIPADYTDYATIKVDAAYTGYEDLRDSIAANLYYGVYGNDFTNQPTGTNVYDQIKKELLANVTFVNRTAAGTYESWVGYKSSNGTWPTPAAALGSETAAVYAYVMYDYANAGAKVFIDSKTPVTLVSSETKAATLAGVAANVTFASNGLANKTNVTIDLSKKLIGAAVTLNGTAPADAVITSDRITFTVDGANFADVSKIAVTGTAVEKIAGVIPTDDTLGMTNEVACVPCDSDGYADYWDFNAADALVNAKVNSSFAPLSKLFDGTIASAAGAAQKDPATTVNLNGTCLCHKHSFTTFARLDHVVKGAFPTGDKSGFVAGVIAELPAAQKVDLARIYIPDVKTGASHFAATNKAYAIMVSSDGINWTVANTIDYVWDVVGGAYVNYDVIVREATATTNQYLCVEFELSSVPATTKYVAVGWVEISGWGANYSSTDWVMTEIEFYAAPVAP